VVVDDVAEPLQRAFEMLLEQEAGVIGADSDPHGPELYYGPGHDSIRRHLASG
jgi:hypothetical protein